MNLQPYYSKLVDYFGPSNELVNSFADKLFSASLVAVETKNEIHTTMTGSAADKARRLLDSISLDTLDSITEFCSILNEVSDNALSNLTEEILREHDKGDISTKTLHRQVSESLQRALSNPITSDIPETSDTLDPLNNHSWNVFKKYCDELIDVIISLDDAESVVEALADQLAAQQVISATKCYAALKEIDDIVIKTKSMFEDAGINIQKRRPENDPFSKFFNVVQQFSKKSQKLSDLLDNMTHGADIAKTPNVEVACQKPSLKTTANSIHCLEAPPCTPVITKCAEYFRARYRMNIKPDNKWPNLTNNQYVDLAVVMKDDANIDNFSRSTIHGNQLEDIICKKELISFSEFEKQAEHGSRFLIEGMPGIGKSTLALEFCKQWREKKMFASYNLMILLRLRNKIVQSFKLPADLVDHGSDAKNIEVYDEIEKEEGKGVFFILEGYDELPTSIQTETSVFTKLIDGMILPNATVLVTTRHSATKALEKVTQIEFTRCFEVLGFSKSSVNKFIESQKNQSALKECLSCFPHIQGCLYIPLNLAIVVYLFNDNKKFSPETSTELYTLIIQCLVLRNLKDQGKIKQLSGFTDLPCEDFEKFQKICKFAYDKLFNEQSLIFYDTDDSLGLMQIEEYDHPHSVGTSTDYSFFHLTMQEYLAAYHISTLPVEEHQQFYDSLNSNSSFTVVLHFLAGLTGLKNINVNISSKFSNFNCIQQLFESKNQALTENVFAPFERIEISRTWPPPVYQDFYALGRCISLSKSKWILGFTFRNITSEHIEMLNKGIASVASPTGKIDTIRASLNLIGKEGVNFLLNIAPEVFQEIRILNLAGIGLDTCHDLTMKLPSLTCLTDLWLHNNCIPCGGHINLIRAISTSQSLQMVSLSKLSPEESSLLLKECTSLKKVELWQLPNESVKAVSTSMADAKSLHKFYLHESKFSAENAQLLSSKFAQITKLHSLNLVNCGISDEAASFIAEGLKNSCVCYLNLDNNLIHNEGGIKLLQVQSAALKEINLCRNPLKEEFAEKILLYEPCFKLCLPHRFK